MRISELAEHVGVPLSTVRYYERVGLLVEPQRTASGYRAYDNSDAVRLLFVTRARRMGLTCGEIAGLLPVWDGTNCAGAQARVRELLDGKQAEIRARIGELRAFSRQLETVRELLDSAPAPDACCTDLSCCVPATGPVSIELGSTVTRPG